MDGPTLYRVLKKAKDEDLLEACHIVADLAHAGGPSPCASLTMACRSRAERLVDKMNGLYLKLRRLDAIKPAPGQPIVHFSHKQGWSASCNANLSERRGFKTTTDPYKVTCGKCKLGQDWRKAVGLP